MWELDCEEIWAPKNWSFWTVVLEKTLESPLDCKEIQPVHSEGDQPWDFFGRNDAEAERPPHAKSWLIGKDSDAGRDWGQEEKGTTEDEMASPTRWTWVWVNSGSWWWTGRPSGCNSWDHKESDTIERLNWTELKLTMATHSGVLAWGIPGMGEPGGLPSMGLQRVGHDWSDLAAAAAATTLPYISAKWTWLLADKLIYVHIFYLIFYSSGNIWP